MRHVLFVRGTPNEAIEFACLRYLNIARACAIGPRGADSELIVDSENDARIVEWMAERASMPAANSDYSNLPVGSLIYFRRDDGL